MAHSNLSHRRTHNLLLISKLLNQRDAASPFTLVLDTIEQTAKPLLLEYIRRAELSKSHTIFLAFETIKNPTGINTFITCFDKTYLEISRAVANAVSNAGSLNKRVLLIIDSLTPLATLSSQPTSASAFNLTTYLTTLLVPPKQNPQAQVSLVAVYHTDIPVTPSSGTTRYAPSPASLLSYLATTIITMHSLSTLLAKKAAREKSLPAPVFGLAEEVEGVIIGLKLGTKHIKPEDRGTILELDHRRKSGRGILEWYFLPASLGTTIQQAMAAQTFRETVTLLDDHPLFRKQKYGGEMSEQELGSMTFELGLTDRQRQERDGVILPYFDAQKAGGGGEGGRILYDMGVEDDFDDEEDEI